MQIQTYLTFDGRCDEALDFYHEALGAEVTSVVRLRDVPDASPDRDGNSVVYASLQIGETTLLAMDGGCNGASPFGGFSLSLITESDEQTEQLFARLADGGTVRAPLAPTFFSSRWGLVADRFGVSWMVLTGSAAQAGQAN